VQTGNIALTNLELDLGLIETKKKTKHPETKKSHPSITVYDLLPPM
jgi:hypothetical protein